MRNIDREPCTSGKLVLLISLARVCALPGGMMAEDEPHAVVDSRVSHRPREIDRTCEAPARTSPFESEGYLAALRKESRCFASCSSSTGHPVRKRLSPAQPNMELSLRPVEPQLRPDQYPDPRPHSNAGRRAVDSNDLLGGSPYRRQGFTLPAVRRSRSQDRSCLLPA